MEYEVGISHQRMPMAGAFEPRREIAPFRHRSPLQGHDTRTDLGTLQPIAGGITRLGQLVLGIGIRCS